MVSEECQLAVSVFAPPAKEGTLAVDALGPSTVLGGKQRQRIQEVFAKDRASFMGRLRCGNLGHFGTSSVNQDTMRSGVGLGS